MIEQAVELLGRVGLVGPAQSQTWSEPSPGRADQPTADQLGPALQRALGDHRLARAGEQRPLVGLLDPVAQHVYGRLQNRADRRTPAPQIAGRQRDRRAIAEQDAQDRDLLERLAGRQILHPLAVPLGVGPGAEGRAAGRTDATGLANQIGEGKRPTPNRNEVVAKPGCEYTPDCFLRAGAGLFGR